MHVFVEKNYHFLNGKDKYQVQENIHHKSRDKKKEITNGYKRLMS